MRDAKSEKSLRILAGSYPTLGQLRAAKPHGSAGLINLTKDQPNTYPTIKAVDDYLSHYT